MKRVPVVVAYLPFALACATLSAISHLSEPPVPQALQFHFADKLMHAGAYFVVGALATFAAARRRGAFARAAVVEAVLLSLAHGVLDEVHQSFVPKRMASAGDAVADVLGALLGALVVTWLARRARAGERAAI